MIREMVRLAVVCGLKGEPGIIGQDEGNCGVLRAIEFWRIKTAKRFDAGVAWFVDMLAEIGQPNLN